MRRFFLLICVAVGMAALLAMRPERSTTTPEPPQPAPRNTALPLRTNAAPRIFSNDPIRGLRDAPLTIVEFADFTCPACADVATTLATLRQRYGPRLRIVWKDLPHLDRLTGSRGLHIAARCAEVQGKFWEYHDALLVEHLRGEEAVHTLAVRLGLDRSAFTTCRTHPASARLVDANVREADRLGITGTPTFFVNGTPLDGPPTFDAFDALLRDAAR